MTFGNSAMHVTSARRLAQLCGLCFAFLLPLTACSQMKTIKWKEEVRLASGQVIIVQRAEDYRLVMEGLSTGWLFNYERIRTTLSVTSKEVAWEGRLKPLALDVTANGDIYLVAVVAEAAGRKEYALPDGINHVAFTYVDNNRWQRIPIAAVPRDFHPNMMADTRGLFIENGSTADFVDLALKAKVDSDPRIDSRFRKWPAQ